MDRFVRLRALCVWVLLTISAAVGFSGSALAQGSGSSDIIRDVRVEGLQRIEAGTVLSYMLVQPGDQYDAARVDRSLKSLFATGLFADVSIRRDGDVLTVTVVENPVVNRVVFEGNDKIDDETLEAETTLKPRAIYTRAKVQTDVGRILTLYRRSGRFAASVEPKIVELPQNRVDVIFEIQEGDVTEIESIRFVGNREFSDSTLRGEIRTRETRWWRFLSTDDTYDPDRIALDRELLRRFYLTEGYADFRVDNVSAELTPDRRRFYLTYTVSEGERYKFGTVKVESTLRGLEPELVMDEVKIESGDWYDAKAVDDTTDKLLDQIGTLGFAFGDVRPRLNRDRDAKTIDVTFEVREGPRVYVERIDITGNVRTLDKVIRREFRLVEGDAFSAAKLKRSRQRIQDLDFFEKVDVQEVPGSAPDKAVINVKVDEKSTGALSVGAGYSTGSGVLGDISIRERNLLGRGQDLRVGLLLGQLQTQIDASFTEPYFLDRPISAGVDVYHVEIDRQSESSFDSVTTGGALRAGYSLTEDWSQSWRYTLKQESIDNVPNDASIYVQESEGSELISEVSHTILYDRRDSRVTPTEGYFGRLTTDVAGLGGSVAYLRNTLGSGYYYPVADKWVASVSGSIGRIVGLGDDVRLLDRFFIGGDDVRGFANDGIGPRDTDTNDALGGEWYYAGSLQLTFPLGLPEEYPLRGRVFNDYGSAWDLSDKGPQVADNPSVRSSVGFGVTWVSPLGPLGVDLGFAVLKESYDDTEILRVNFGTRF